MNPTLFIVFFSPINAFLVSSPLQLTSFPGRNCKLTSDPRNRSYRSQSRKKSAISHRFCRIGSAHKMAAEEGRIIIESGRVGRSLGNGSKWRMDSIYLVPDHMKDPNPIFSNKLYTPQCVSIGPYHYGKPHLAAMEDHKTRALQQFLNRTGKNREDFYRALLPMTENLMDSYLQLGNEWKGNKDRFLYLMIYDESFLYELMTGASENLWDGYGEEDPIFSDNGFDKHCPLVLPDILMLENQLPLPVIQCLIDVVENRPPGDHQNYSDARDLVYKFLAIENSPDIPEWEGLHILDLSRKGLAKGFVPISDTRREASVFLKSATELQDAGIKLTVNAGEDDASISFATGAPRLPLLDIESQTKAHFLNAIAFESLHQSAQGEVSSYVAFLKGLIPSAEDAAALVSSNMIQSDIGGAPVVAQLIKDISANVMFNDSIPRAICARCEIRMRKWRRRLREWCRVLKDDHLKNPCTVTALCGGFATFGLVLFRAIKR